MSTKTALAACLLAIIAWTIACENQTLVTKIDPTAPPQNVDGVIFSLPETVTVTEVPLTKVASTPGVFHEWTEFFYPDLTSDDYATEPATTFKVGVPTFSTRGQTDPHNVYMAHIKAKQFETKTLLLEFNEDGIVARTEASSKDETIDIITSGIKTAASIVAPLLGAGAAPAMRKLDAAQEDCRKKFNAKVAANAEAAKLAARKRGVKGAAARAAVTAAAATEASDRCYEENFKNQLSARELALYESLDSNYRSFLRENFGFDFLLYIAKKEEVDSSVKSANVEFFLTLSEAQKKVIKEKLHASMPCVEAPAGSHCLAPQVKSDLVKAKAMYDRIQALRARRETFIAEATPANVNNSTNLEYRLKELDAQIKTLDETYFLGTSQETSATARFEFTPTPGGPPQDFFTYAAGGNKPGICKNSVPNDNPGVFRANWPRKLSGACRATADSFEAGDFQDLDQLVSRLRAVAPGAPAPPAGTAPDLVSAYLYNHLTPATIALLAGRIEKPQEINNFRTALITDMNAVLTNGASIYVPAIFVEVKLSADTIKLIQSGPPPADIVHLNRLLFEDAYRQEIYRQASWVSRPVKLEVDPATPGTASAVYAAVAANKLAEPGDRGFPYRIAASSVAKLTDDGIEKGRSDVRIAQFGPVKTLPAGLGGRRSTYKLTYYDASGAIKIFDMTADALIEKQNITDLTDAATTFRDSETAKLKRQTDLLNAKKAKLEAEKALLDADKALKAAQGGPSPTPTP